jgi:hypothetical protein
VELATFVTETVFASTEFTKVLCSLRDDIVEEPENDTASGPAIDSYIELKSISIKKT